MRLPLHQVLDALLRFPVVASREKGLSNGINLIQLDRHRTERCHHHEMGIRCGRDPGDLVRELPVVWLIVICKSDQYLIGRLLVAGEDTFLIAQHDRSVKGLRASVEHRPVSGERFEFLQVLCVLMQAAQSVEQCRVGAATSFGQFPDVPLQDGALAPFYLHERSV